ncbi:hypothetical protein [Streptomyces sp. CC224B]|uniref:hypothetical protein n=1 Tax=Streptomyces sp. CC224B TaxID=3044571 RepID=UPI0024A88238|nr:hypothetical protein [Streptomyces sp. CC224B]
MPGAEPYAGHDGAAVLLLVGSGLVIVPALVVYAIRQLVRARTQSPPRSQSQSQTQSAYMKSAYVRSAAGWAWAAAAGVYTWGVLHLFLLDDAAQSRACAKATGTARFTGYEPSYIPLHFGCRTRDGRTVEAVIPAYVNPSALFLTVCAVVLTGFAIAHSRERHPCPDM